MPMDWVNCCNVVRDAFRAGMRDWVDNVMVTGGTVMAPVCVLPTGSLKGTVPLSWRVQQAVSALPDPAAMVVGTEFGNTLQRAVDGWAAGFTANWSTAFPTLVMFPGPFAPPTPAAGIMLLSMGASSDLYALTSAVLHMQLKPTLARLGGDTPELDGALRGLTDWVERSFRTWLGVAFLRGDRILGSGPVVTFLPPQVMAGPVMNGTIQGRGVLGGPPFGM